MTFKRRSAHHIDSLALNLLLMKINERMLYSFFGKSHDTSYIIHVKDRRWHSGLDRFALQAEGWVLESQPRQTQVVKTGSDSSTTKRSAIIGVSVTCPRR